MRREEQRWMDRYQYLLLMGLCLLLTLPLELLLGARVWRRPRRLLQSLIWVVVVFSVWDMVAIARGTWHYSDRYTTGVLLPFAMPVEELVFFLVVPVCALLTYEAVGNVLAAATGHRQRRTTQSPGQSPARDET